MIETFVMYVSAHTRLNVFRIEATAIMIGISTAGSVPKTKNRITSEPAPPISASVRMLGPEPPPEGRPSRVRRAPRRQQRREGVRRESRPRREHALGRVVPERRVQADEGLPRRR